MSDLNKEVESSPNMRTTNRRLQQFRLTHPLSRLTTILIFLIATPLPVHSSTSKTIFPVDGPCQARCLKQYGEIVSKTTNIGTEYTEINVQNNTDFNLCKLGCSSPGFNDLHLPTFRFGQLAHNQIMTASSASTHRPNVVKEVNILCLDEILTSNNTRSGSRTVSGKVLLTFSAGVQDPQAYIHMVEVISHEKIHTSDDQDPQAIVFQEWCYTPTCNVTFHIPSTTSDVNFQIKLSSFDKDGAVGGVINSRWYEIANFASTSAVNLIVVDRRWIDDKAAVELSMSQANQFTVSACLMKLSYRNTLSSEFKTQNFFLDHTRSVLLKPLEFAQSYTVKLDHENVKKEDVGSMGSVNFDMPACMSMVNDPTMCAPPPVNHIEAVWNTTSKDGQSLIVSWNYVTDEDNVPLMETNAKLAMSHFILTINALITPNNEQCQRLESMRRDVTWTHRQVVFYVPDANCNYEGEIVAVDMKHRRSISKKIQISRINKPAYMYMLLNEDIPGAAAWLLITMFGVILLIGALLGYVQRKKVAAKKVDDGKNETDANRLVYAFVDAGNSSRTIIGKRPPSSRLSSDNSTTGSNTHLRPNTRVNAYCDQYQRHYPQADMHEYPHLHSNPPKTYSNGCFVPTTMKRIDDEHAYETISERASSQLSDYITWKSEWNGKYPKFNFRDMAKLQMPAFAYLEDYKNLHYVRREKFSLTKTFDAEGNEPWRMVSAVDVIDEVSYTIKFAREHKADRIEEMRKELKILNEMRPHPNCTALMGLVTENEAEIHGTEVLGILLENCRGGTLRRYIHATGSALRRNAFGSPNSYSTYSKKRDVVAPSPPSSGYDSIGRSGAVTPEVQIDRDVYIVTARFCRFAEQIAAALEHLHCAGVVHTHVTTSNIYLAHDYSDPLSDLCDQTVKLGDFGYSATSAESIEIEPCLQPPEVCAGKQYEAKGDIWQFGTCLIEMCSLGLWYQVQKELPISGISQFDKSAATLMLVGAAKKCLNPRNRPSASDLQKALRLDSSRNSQMGNCVELSHINQSVLV